MPLRRSRFAHLVMIVLATCAVLVATVAPAASGPATDQVELETLERSLQRTVGEHHLSRNRLAAERSDLVLQLEILNAAIAGNEAAIDELTVERRLIADHKLRAALEDFVGGSPASEAFTGGRLLSAVDTDLRALQAEGPTLEEQRAEVGDQLVVVGAADFELGITLRLAEAELAEVSDTLEWYRDTSGRSPITGRANPNGNDRPALVVKIDNVPRARPQAGINQADLVFVELVEGGQTRLAATYHSAEVPVVGPVRSMRTTDVGLVQMLNRPLFANSGANASTTRIINESPLVNIGAATDAGRAYYRSPGRPAPHNLFSSTAALRREDRDRAGNPPPIMVVRRPGTGLPNAAQNAAGVDIAYPNTSVSYRWNGTGWARSQDGRAFVDTAGVRVAPETLIVRFTSYGVSPADAQSPEARVTGNGVAWMFTEGQVIVGTWEKPNRNVPTVYRDADGVELNILPGRVWIELPQPGTGTLR